MVVKGGKISLNRIGRDPQMIGNSAKNADWGKILVFGFQQKL